MYPESRSVPCHVGVIMDGNGRWASSRGMMRTQGHLEGLKAAKRIVRAASGLGISYLTLYTFSTENWKRTAEEVGFIMGLVRKYLRSELDFCIENKIRVRHAGDRNTLPPDIVKDLDDTGDATRNFTGMQVILALNYGGRDEIARAVNKMINSRLNNQECASAEPVTVDMINQYLDNPDIPDPELIIRTAGEFRTSNFLLWESAYSEYYISEKLWPDWEEADLRNAIESFNKRDRRFGGVSGETQHL